MSGPESNRPVDKAPPQLGELLEDALHQGKILVQAELSLARRELKDELGSASRSALFFVLGAMSLQAAISTLGALLVITWGPGYAAIGVVVALLLIGAVFAFAAVRLLERKKLPRTSARLAFDAKQVLDTVK